jgi:hypothetical protein
MSTCQTSNNINFNHIVGEQQQQQGQLPVMGSHYRGWGTTDEDWVLLMRTGLGPTRKDRELQMRTSRMEPQMRTRCHERGLGATNKDQEPQTRTRSHKQGPGAANEDRELQTNTRAGIGILLPGMTAMRTPSTYGYTHTCTHDNCWRGLR